VADPQEATLEHGDRSGEAFGLSQAGQFPGRGDDRGGGLVGEAQDHDASVADGRIGADVTEADVQ
jgi:hypothetical protein